MSQYFATISWTRNGEKFIDNRYHRSHRWHFDGGETIHASSSPQVVPTPLSDPSAVDPEEAFVASLSSCHMLWFLSIAAKKKFVIEEYKDKATGIMEKDETGSLAITKVTLFPEIIYAAEAAPSLEEDIKMHEEAGKRCFIANSVKTTINIEPSMNTITKA